ncbi:MAG: orotidine-5'-phosphate decarboxylase [Lachnospiraceae bacterium]|nr:orotidine-5'-phosphate decarboxylase [Lachnospiraceae bacterium]
MLIDKVVEETMKKKNPCIVGLDPEWDKIPDCYKSEDIPKAQVVLNWAMDVIDAVKDIIIAVKPQMAFYEVYGAEGFRVVQDVVKYAHSKGLIVVDDSKRNDIGNTARAYAFAHLAEEGPIKADFLTVSPFLGTDSIQPFMDVAIADDKGVFVLVKTSNPGSVEISEAINVNGEKISSWLAEYINGMSESYIGKSGYSAIGAVIGATFPEEAGKLRRKMKRNYFLVPGFGAQGGSARDIVSCFNEDGLGALISSSRGILYQYVGVKEYDGSREMYGKIVREQAVKMKEEVYQALKEHCSEMKY